jgi:K+-sensing histidine kinase KdpD|tara:strand:- start:139 stop:333 length:195 start_codon:yes stop_codon:yes gene_type:complete
MASKSEDSVVKIDSELLNEVEEFINLDENKFRYANKKQFIDLAVIDFLLFNKKKVKRRKDDKHG